ncbi:MAG: YrzE family protein [bacterium]|nr:YrzE family protein [bacterium]
MRNVLALVGGLIVGSVVNMALVLLNAHVLYPMPEGTDMSDPEQMNAYVATLPTPALLVVVAAHLGQAFFGGWVAARMAASRGMILALIIGVLTLLGVIYNMTQIEHPAWMFVELPLCLIVAWLAGRLGQRRPGAAV